MAKQAYKKNIAYNRARRSMIAILIGLIVLFIIGIFMS